MNLLLVVMASIISVAPEVHVPVLHPDVLVGEYAFLLVSDLEGRELRSSKDLGFRDQDLYLPGGIAGVGGAFTTLLSDHAVDGDHWTRG